MIVITANAQRILQWYKDTFVDFKTPQEYGRSAFWLWYDQICVEIRELERKHPPFGYYLKAPMEYWGDITYSKENICGTMITKIEDFDFDIVKFKDWLLHIERHRIPYSVCDTCFGFSSVLYDKSQKCGIIKPDGKPLIRPVFDDIINFHHSSNDYNTLHAIGFINDRVYEIATDGNVTLLHMTKEDYLNTTHKFFESVHRQKIIENKQYNTMNNTNKIRLTESQLHSIIKESVKQVLSELDYKAYLNTADARLAQSSERNRDLPYDQDVSRRADLVRRALELKKMGAKAFNRDYGFSNDNSTVGMRQDDCAWHNPDLFAIADKTSPIPKLKANFYSDFHSDYLGPIEDMYADDAEALEAYNKAKDEMGNYKKGNYDYEKGGRGWHLKDNVDESIRRAIRKVLR